MESHSTSSYLAIAEPSWAEYIPENQLKGIINLSSLFSKELLLSDVHIGDNKNFFNSYINNNVNGLFFHITELINHGIVKLLLRKSFIRPNSEDKEVECNQFIDVYNSWIKLDNIESWINQELSDKRKEYFKTLDSFDHNAIIRYDYKNIKDNFIDIVKSANKLNSASWFKKTIYSLPKNLQEIYQNLVTKNWFTLSDFYSFFQEHGYSGYDDIMMIHGLFNELAYNNCLNSQLVGTDLHGKPIENIFWKESKEIIHHENINDKYVLDAIFENAKSVLDAPSLSVLGLLNATEICQLREIGKNYFELLSLSQDSLYIDGSKDFTKRFYDATLEYWELIIEYLKKRHPYVAQKRNKLGIFTGSFSSPISKIAKSTFSFAINVGSNIADTKYPGVRNIKDELEKATKDISFRFLFWADTEELKKLKKVIPDRSWLTKSRPSLFIK